MNKLCANTSSTLLFNHWKFKTFLANRAVFGLRGMEKKRMKINIDININIKRKLSLGFYPDFPLSDFFSAFPSVTFFLSRSELLFMKQINRCNQFSSMNLSSFHIVGFPNCLHKHFMGANILFLPSPDMNIFKD